MDNRLEIYKTWAPDDSIWSVWVKPILFATAMNYQVTTATKLEIFKPWYKKHLNNHTMVIVDRKGEKSVLEALGVALCGYHPVPLYNGAKQAPVKNKIQQKLLDDNSKNATKTVGRPKKGRTMVVNVDTIARTLYKATTFLQEEKIPLNGPPVFMLDANRLDTKKTPMYKNARQDGYFDNRWCVFPQDMPSGTFLLEKGIDTIILSTSDIKEDLLHILFRYQEKGLKILLYKKEEILKEYDVPKPTKYKAISYKAKVMAGLALSAAGGFGRVVPEGEGGGG